MKKLYSIDFSPWWLDENEVIKDLLITFRKLDEYAVAGSDTARKSESQQFDIKFISSNSIEMYFEWPENKLWNLKCTKKAYIPSERYFVVSILNWLNVNFDKFNNARKYMAGWNIARKNFDRGHILDMGVSYFYDDVESWIGLLWMEWRCNLLGK